MADPTALLAIDAGIKRCANAAADAMTTTDPTLNRDHLYISVEEELWLAVTDAARLAKQEAMFA